MYFKPTLGDLMDGAPLPTTEPVLEEKDKAKTVD